MFRRFAMALLLLAGLTAGAAADGFDPPAGYYDSATGTGAALKAQLNSIIDGHSFFSYGDARTILQDTDVDPNDSDRMLLVYNRVSLDVSSINPGGSIPGWDSGNSWNREHTWPRSLGVGSSGDDNSDLHMLRPSNPFVNNSRGNLPLAGEFGAQPFGLINSSTRYYPGDAEAGMVARQLFYADVRYDGADSSTSNLTLTSGASGSSAGDLDDLIEWHYLATPDAFERRRNDVIHDDYQGNRNPFVDHPELAWSVFIDQQNDTQLTLAGETATAGATTKTIDLGSVFVGGTTPSTQMVTLNKSGQDGTYYEVATSGAATSSVNGRLNAFAMGGSGSQSIEVGLSVSTASAGQQTGSVTIDNLDVTTGAGSGAGAQDGDDTVDLTFTVFDHAQASFDAVADTTTLTLDFGTVTAGDSIADLGFEIFNQEQTVGFTAGLELDTIFATGDTEVLTTDVMAFTGASALDGGLSSVFSAMLDTSTAGVFSATYNLLVSDIDLPGALGGALTLNLMAEVLESALAGDFNEDGTVDAADYTTWRAGLGTLYTEADYTRWRANYGQTTAGASSSVQVPEPTTGWLFLLGLMLLGKRRR